MKRSSLSLNTREKLSYNQGYSSEFKFLIPSINSFNVISNPLSSCILLLILESVYIKYQQSDLT